MSERPVGWNISENQLPFLARTQNLCFRSLPLMTFAPLSSLVGLCPAWPKALTLTHPSVLAAAAAALEPFPQQMSPERIELDEVRAAAVNLLALLPFHSTS